MQDSRTIAEKHPTKDAGEAPTGTILTESEADFVWGISAAMEA
jgi:hypothetical protein